MKATRTRTIKIERAKFQNIDTLKWKVVKYKKKHTYESNILSKTNPFTFNCTRTPHKNKMFPLKFQYLQFLYYPSLTPHLVGIESEADTLQDPM